MLLSGFQSSPGSFEIHWERPYRVNFKGPAGIVNAVVYKTEPIFTGLEHGKLSWFLTHWGRVMQTCMSKLTIIGSDNGLFPGRCQAIIWTNTGISLIRTLGMTFSGILSEIHIFSSKKMHRNMSSAKLTAILSQPQCVNTAVVCCKKQDSPGYHLWVALIIWWTD